MIDPKWQKAMAKEIQLLETNHTCTLVNLPFGKKPISCKWVQRVKYNSDGSIQRHKARLVIHGDLPIEGFDYNETLAPVAKMTSVYCFLAVAVAKVWGLHHLDVNNAFLHGCLGEEFYMKLPPGFSYKGQNQVCKL